MDRAHRVGAVRSPESAVRVGGGVEHKPKVRPLPLVQAWIPGYNYAVFESIAAYKAWRDSDLFAEHRNVIEPLVERSEPGLWKFRFG